MRVLTQEKTNTNQKSTVSTPPPTPINQCQKAISSQTVQYSITERVRAPKVHIPILIENFPAFPATALLHHLLYSLKPHYRQYFGFCAFSPSLSPDHPEVEKMEGAFNLYPLNLKC